MLLTYFGFDSNRDSKMRGDYGSGLIGPRKRAHYYKMGPIALFNPPGHRLRLAAAQFGQRRKMARKALIAITLTLAVTDKNEACNGHINLE
jgi:hypothetical protein